MAVQKCGKTYIKIKQLRKFTNSKKMDFHKKSNNSVGGKNPVPSDKKQKQILLKIFALRVGVFSSHHDFVSSM